MPWPLVGREVELEFVGAALSGDATGGVVITGTAGVGKTRLAVEVARVAESQGCVVEWVRATQSAASIPLGAFASLLPAAGGGSAEGVDLLARAREALVERAGERRLVLCVDDGQLLDHASAVLVHQLVAAGEAFAVVTVRRGERVPDALQALWKDELCAWLELEELSFSELERVLAEALGGPVDGRSVHALWELTRGNALFVRELVRYGVERGILADDNGIWRWRGQMTAGLRLTELVGARLEVFGPATLRVLEVVAAGAPLEIGLLEPDETAELETLERREIVLRRVDGRRRAVDVAHPLHGEAIRAGLSGMRLEAIQRRLADAVEARGGRRHTDVARLAAWRLESGGGDPELFERAAGQALAALDFVLAERFAHAAVRAGGGLAARLAFGQALAGAGRADEADRLLADLEQHVSADGERAAVAVARARNLFWGADRAGDADAVLRRAEHAVSDRGVRDELSALRVRLVAGQGRPLEALAAAGPLLSTEGVHEQARLHAVVAMSEALLSRGRMREALALVETWEPVARRHRQQLPHVEPQLLGERAVALRLAGRLIEATEAAQQMYALALARRSALSTATAASTLGLVWLARGQVRTSLRFFRESAALLRDADPIGILRWALAGVAQAAAQAGEAEPARQAVEELERTPLSGFRGLESELELGRAWSAAAAGERSRARALAGDAVQRAQSSGQDAFAMRALHERCRLGDAVAAAPQLAALAGTVEGAFAQLAAAHAAALVAGDPEALSEVAAGFARDGALLLAAEAAQAAAAAYRNAGRTGSAGAAAERAAGWLGQCEGARPPTLHGDPIASELTPREREIAVLAAGGLTSREIAERLVVSVRTVDNHLQRTYRKLGIAGREQLSGLVAPAAE